MKALLMDILKPLNFVHLLISAMPDRWRAALATSIVWFSLMNEHYLVYQSAMPERWRSLFKIVATHDNAADAAVGMFFVLVFASLYAMPMLYLAVAYYIWPKRVAAPQASEPARPRPRQWGIRA